MSTPNSQPNRSLYSPRHWPLWLGLGLLWLLCQLPYPLLVSLSRPLGRLLLMVIPRRRHIAQTNLERCFAALSPEKRKQILRQHFESMAMMLFELGLSWWGSQAKLGKLVRIDGLEHLDAALAHGKGALLLGAHYTTLEISGRLLTLSTQHPIQSMYRPHEHPLLNHVMTRGREACLDAIIPRDDIRSLLRALKQNKVVWYAPDQAYEGKGHALVPFFGIDAPTNTGTSRIAKLSGTRVLPFVSHRLPGAQGYQLKILPALDDFPSDDEVADTARLQQIFEAQIRAFPEQYFWVHRRFKRKRDKHANIY